MKVLINGEPWTCFNVSFNLGYPKIKIYGILNAKFERQIIREHDWSTYVGKVTLTTSVAYNMVNNYITNIKDIKPETKYCLKLIDNAGVSEFEDMLLVKNETLDDGSIKLFFEGSPEKGVIKFFDEVLEKLKK